MNVNQLIILALIMPLVTACFIVFNRTRPIWREASTLSGSFILFLVLVWLIREVTQTGFPPAFIVLSVISGLNIQFQLEPLGLLFAFVVSMLWFINSVYTVGYASKVIKQHQTRLYLLFSIAIFCTLGVAFAGDLFTLFLFYEGLTLSTYPLVIHKGDEKSLRGGRAYLGILLFTSICFFLVGIIWLWQVAGTLEFRDGGILPTSLSPWQTLAMLLLFVYGLGKAAMFPLHYWLPSAMVAPTPVSALLHAVAVVKVGVFALLKIFLFIFGVDQLSSLPINLPLYIAGISIIYASIIALKSDNLKQRLAYSTISQLGYVSLAALVLTPLSSIGAILHIIVHAFGKITLFFAAGAIYVVSKKTKISELGGIGKVMPITMGCFAIGCLSMIGLPPVAGFISKWYILQGTMQAENWFVMAVLITSTLLNATYFLPILHVAFFKPSELKNKTINEASPAILFATCFTATMTILLFLMPNKLIALAQYIVSDL